MRTWCEVRNFASQKFRLTPDTKFWSNLQAGSNPDWTQFAVVRTSPIQVQSNAHLWVRHRYRSRKFFWACEGFLPKFPQTCPKDCWATFCAYIFSSRLSLRMTSQKQDFMWFCRRWMPFFNSNQVGHHFYPDFQVFGKGFHRFCPDFHGFFPNFQGFFPDFPQIKTFGGAPVLPLSTSLQSDVHICPYSLNATTAFYFVTERSHIVVSVCLRVCLATMHLYFTWPWPG